MRTYNLIPTKTFRYLEISGEHLVIYCLFFCSACYVSITLIYAFVNEKDLSIDINLMRHRD